MDENISDRAKAERDRILDMLEHLSKKRLSALMPIIDNVAWMRVKLDDTREAIRTSGVVIPYDNGGGQKGLRENPLFKGYESLWKAYIAGAEKIIACLPDESASELSEETPKTILELVRDKHKKEA